MGAFGDIEAQSSHLLPEVLGVLVNLIPQSGGFREHIEHLAAGSGNGRSQGVGEQIGTAALTQQIDDFLTGAGVAAGSAAQSLAQSTGDDVHTAHHAAVFGSAFAVLAHEAHSVAVVHHDQSAVFVGQVADALQVGDEAVHGEDTVGGDQLDAAVFGLFQLGLQVFHVVVLIAQSLGFAQADAVDDGGVVQLVGNDGVLRAEQRLEQAAVGVEAGRIEDGVVHTQELADLVFQFLVQFLCAADEADGGQAVAPLVIAVLGRLDHFRVVGQAQIVVGAHIHHIVSLGGVDAGALRSGDKAFVLIGAGFPDAFQLFGVDLQCLFHDMSFLLLIIKTDETGLFLCGPVQHNLTGVAGDHGFEALFEFGVMEVMGDHRMEIQAALNHGDHLVPGGEDLAAIDALEGQTLEDHMVPVDLGVGALETQQGDLAAVAHQAEQLVEAGSAAAHFQTHIKAFLDL